MSIVQVRTSSGKSPAAPPAPNHSLVLSILPDIETNRDDFADEISADTFAARQALAIELLKRNLLLRRGRR
ncbi:MAG TPA: hypothetical protein VGJ08_14895 [Rhizomicrobium sp.]|jgi:hypothetical protein